MQLDVILDILKVSVGLIYLYLEYNAKRGLWIAGVIMPAISLWLFYNKGLYADCAINFYYLVIAIYGYITWSRKSASGEKPELPISSVPGKVAAILGLVFAAMWLFIAWVLASFTDSTVVWLDSFTTALSIVGLWMLARKYIQQWFVWLVVDAVYVWLYYHKGIYFSGTLYALYTVIAIFGYRKWRRMLAMQS
ncbi:MAG: nicotinamide riboside transporter PnuC [Bacteroides sp.]|nr:nicotinamide riboside transporter PnuC [Lachnospiraceae bacterium]MCM1332148.1 nicotinamide riboside transporter PnuC [Bacteroides sp.]MCM1390789.1 nicotinamide riboside transporter PnuC [Bacteroides sp.]